MLINNTNDGYIQYFHRIFSFLPQNNSNKSKILSFQQLIRYKNGVTLFFFQFVINCNCKKDRQNQEFCDTRSIVFVSPEHFYQFSLSLLINLEYLNESREIQH